MKPIPPIPDMCETDGFRCLSTIHLKCEDGLLLRDGKTWEDALRNSFIAPVRIGIGCTGIVFVCFCFHRYRGCNGRWVRLCSCKDRIQWIQKTWHIRHIHNLSDSFVLLSSVAVQFHDLPRYGVTWWTQGLHSHARLWWPSHGGLHDLGDPYGHPTQGGGLATVVGGRAVLALRTP